MPRPHSALVVLLAAALVIPVFPAAASVTDVGGTGAVCDRQPALNTEAPPGAVVIDPAVAGDLSVRTQAAPPAAPIWLPPGPQDEGAANHDSGEHWVLEHNTIQGNRGAALMAGDRQEVRANCLRDNGQYGMNAYRPDNAITGLLVEGNEITGTT